MDIFGILFGMLEFYTGASKDGTKCEGGLGSSVVRKLADPLVVDCYFIFCDNFFTSVALAKDLLATNTYLCGTTRSNREMFPDSLKKTRRSVEHSTPHADGAWLNELGSSQ